MSLNVEIITPSQSLQAGEATEVVAPAALGEVGILPMHARYLTTLTAGELRIRSAANETRYQITGGLLTVSDDKVTILVDGLSQAAA